MDGRVRRSAFALGPARFGIRLGNFELSFDLARTRMAELLLDEGLPEKKKANFRSPSLNCNG
jgi:hypothetical protein